MSEDAEEELTECQLLKSAVRGLREEEPHKHNLKGQPTAIRDEPLPADVVQANRVDECGEEIGHASKELE